MLQPAFRKDENIRSEETNIKGADVDSNPIHLLSKSANIHSHADSCLFSEHPRNLMLAHSNQTTQHNSSQSATDAYSSQSQDRAKGRGDDGGVVSVVTLAQIWGWSF